MLHKVTAQTHFEISGPRSFSGRIENLDSLVSIFLSMLCTMSSSVVFGPVVNVLRSTFTLIGYLPVCHLGEFHIRHVPMRLFWEPACYIGCSGTLG
jgi:hypothetical protein